MKITTYLAGFLLLFSSVLFSRCTADRGSVSTPGEIIAQGNWSVQTLYAGSDQTGRYAGYHFTFAPGGRMMVQKGGEVSTGSWTWERNVRAEVLRIQLSEHSDLAALDAEWTLEQWGLYTLRLKRGADLLVLKQLPLR